MQLDLPVALLYVLTGQARQAEIEVAPLVGEYDPIQNDRYKHQASIPIGHGEHDVAPVMDP